jgi:polysaccharide biosynthesis transport protein
MSHPAIIKSDKEVATVATTRETQAGNDSPQSGNRTEVLVRRRGFNTNYGQPVNSRQIEPYASTTPQASLSRLLEPFFVYKRSLIFSLLLSVLVGWVALVLWPRTYESVAKLQLLVGRESVGLDPSSTTTQTLLMQKSLEEDVNTALEILGSRDVAELVVNEIGVEPILAGTLPTVADTNQKSELQAGLDNIKELVGDWLLSAFNASGVRDLVSDQERAVLRLQDTVYVYAPKKSSTLIVHARSKTPEMAHALANSYIKHFIDRHVNVAATHGSYAFFEQQAKAAESDLEKLLETRSEMLQSHKLVSASNRFNSLTLQQSAIETTILNTVAQIKQAQAELNDVTQHIQGLDKEIVAGKQTQPDQTIIGMRIALYNAELEEKRLLSRYSDSHPKLEQVRQQVVAAREALGKLEQESQTQSTTPNPILLKLEEDLLRAKTRIAGLDSLLLESEQQFADKQREINELLELELKLEQLDREIEVAKKNLASLREKEEQSRVIENLRQQRISSVGIAQSPSMSAKPTNPRKTIVAAAALLLGLGFGVCLVGMKEVSRKELRNADDVQRLIGYPVLVDVPRVRALANTTITLSDLSSPKFAAIRTACEELQAELLLSSGTAFEDVPRGKTIGIVGVNENSGASTLAMALALQYSDSNFERTTLIDLDTKKGTVSEVFGLLSEGAEANCAVRVGEQSLNLVGSSANGIACRGNADLKDLLTMLDHVAKDSEVVILDLPPNCRPNRNLFVASQLDQVVIVVESQKTPIDAALRLVHQIEKNGGVIAGVVLNKSQNHLPRWLKRMLG